MSLTTNQTPSLQQLIDRAVTTMVQRFGESHPATEAIAAAIGGAAYGQYAHRNYLFDQLNPETADEDWLYLWAERLNTARILPQYAKGTVVFNGSNDTVFVPSGAILKTQDNREYKVTVATLSNQNVPVIAMIRGESHNLTAGITLNLTSAIQGLNPESITVIDISGGSEIEDLEHWRNRVAASYKENEAIGRNQDYQTWAISSHPDIDFAITLDNTPALGNVTVYVGQRDIEPIVSNEIKQVAQDYINSKRLAGCHVFVQHPQKKIIDITLSGVSDINTRDAITDALQSFINSKLGLKNLKITASDLVVAITSVTSDFALISPISTTTATNNEVITLGAITWQ